MINKVELIGNLGADPEAKTMPSGGNVVNLSIATTRRWKDRNTGERKDATEWHRVEVAGCLSQREWKTQAQEEFLRKLAWVSLWPTSAMKRPCDSHVKHESMETLLSPPVPR